jgi:hypothetical protein
MKNWLPVSDQHLHRRFTLFKLNTEYAQLGEIDIDDAGYSINRGLARCRV